MRWPKLSFHYMKPLYSINMHNVIVRNTKTVATNGLASTGILSIKFNIDRKFKGSIFYYLLINIFPISSIMFITLVNSDGT